MKVEGSASRTVYMSFMGRMVRTTDPIERPLLLLLALLFKRIEFRAESGEFV